MKRVGIAILGLIALLGLPSLATAQQATGSIYGQIQVQGTIERADGKTGLQGSVYWLTIIPKAEEDKLNAGELMSVDTAKSYAVMAKDGSFRRDGLAPGTYIVAFVFDKSQAATPLSRTLDVRNLGGVTTHWPAEDVTVVAGGSTEVNFTRAAYPPLPAGFEFPDTGDPTQGTAMLDANNAAASASQAEGTGWQYRELGIGLVLVGFLCCWMVIRYRRPHGS